MRYSLRIEYDGTAYSGWQIQKSEKTIQGEIESALKVILKNETGLIGSGRTDAGVHAKGQVAHFDSDNHLDENQIQRSLNGLLPPDIRILDCNLESDNFHARFSVKERKYSYYISKQPTAIFRLYSWNINSKLAVDKMNLTAQKLIGKHNFKSFCRNISEVPHHFCTIKSINWKNKKNIIKFDITADRFLHGMVRALVGTMIDIGMNKIDLKDFKDIIKSEDRTKASQAAPPLGLFLEKVIY